jgi:hypothetical protein
MCTNDEDCKIFNTHGERFYCVATNQNPNINTTHFDNLINAIVTVFMITTMEGWTDIFIYVSKTFKNDYYINTIIIAIYFFTILFVGGYYLINLYLAVINYTYCETELKNKKKRKKENLSLYGILMETFQKTGEVENENLPEYDYDEIKYEEKEEILNKLKEECNLFNHNLDKYTISYEGIDEMHKIRNYKPKELFELKKQILSESKLALEEYDRKIKLWKKIGPKNKEISSKENNNDNYDNHLNNYIDVNNKIILLNKKRISSSKKINFDNFIDRKIALEEIIPLSIEKTKMSFKKDLERGNIEVEKKYLRKKSILLVKKQKINEILYNDLGEVTQEKINLSSGEESFDNNNTNINKYTRNSAKKYSSNSVKKNSNLNLNYEKENDEKKKTDISNKNTNFNDDDQKCNYVRDLTFSINTSEDSSCSFGYINETVNENNKNDKSKNIDYITNKDKDKDNKKNINKILCANTNEDIIDNKDRSPNNLFRNSNKVNKEEFFQFVEYYKRKFDEDKNKIEDKETIDNKSNKNDIIKNEENENKKNKENLITKKTLVEIDHNLCNKMIINKPDNPLISVPKHKQETFIKKKIKDFQEDFKFKEIFNEKDNILLIKKLKNKDQKFLNFLKNTKETSKKFQIISIEEMRKYEDFLENQDSLEISKIENEPKLLIANYEENNNDSLLTQNQNKENEIERIEEINAMEKRINDWENKKNTIKRMLTQDRISEKRSTFSTFEFYGRPKKFELTNKNINLNSLNSNDNLNSINTNNKKTISSNQSKTKSKSKLTKDKNDNNKIDKNDNKSIDNKITFNYDDVIIKEKIKKIENEKKNINIKAKINTKVKKRTKSVKSNRVKFSNLTIKFQKESINNNDDLTIRSFLDKKQKDLEKEKEKEQFNKKKHLNSYRNYMKYLNFTLNKDYKIRDKFNVDYFQADVMGKSEYIETNIIKANKLDPLRIFNEKNLNLKNNSYVKYLKTEKDFINKDEIKNNLKFLSHYVINSMYSRTKNFRDLAKKTHEENSLNIIHIKGNTISESEIKDFRSEINKTSTIHKSSFIINNRHKEIKQDTLNEIEEEKKKTREALFNDFIELSLRKKSILFFDFDKIFLDKKKLDDEHKQSLAKIEMEINWEQEDKKLKIEEIRNFDIKTNSLNYNEWSGYHVMNFQEDKSQFSEWNSLLEKIENVNVIIWDKELFFYLIKRIRYFLFILSTNKFFEYFVLLIVLLNMIIMLLQGNLIPPEYNYIFTNLNLGFNSFFIFEFVIKFIGLGPIIYFSDAFTYLDLVIIALAILDISSNFSENENTVSSKFDFLRILRIFRVLRIAKILRRLKSFRKISRGISNSLNNVAYNSLILFIFIVIFQLLGVTFFSQSVNYRGFLASFYTTFQLLTLENWNGILFELKKFNTLSVIYLISLIFIGNYILFNLFISILLNSFDSLADTNIDEEEEFIKSLPEEFRKYEKHKKEINLRKRENKMSKIEKKKNKKEIGANFINDVSSSSDENSFNEEEKEEENKIMQVSFLGNIGMKQAKKFMRDRKIANDTFCENECENSLFIFSQTSAFRIFCKNLIKLKKFDRFILLMIFVSTLRLILDTFIAGEVASKIFDFLDITFTTIFFFEMIIKIIALGFILDEGSYLKNNWNRLDFTIVLFSLIDLQYFIEKYINTSDQNEIVTSFNFLKVLRLLRTLRPLRFISHNVSLKIIIISLFDSLDSIQNVLVIVFIVILIFSIIGMNLFYNLYHTCYIYNSDESKFKPIENFIEYLNFNITNTVADSLRINKIVRKKLLSLLIILI